MVEILCGEDWEHSEDISTVPQEHWRWFLGSKVGNWRVKKIAGTAKPLLANLRILQQNKGWKELGLESWPAALEFFGLDETKWNWLQAGEPVLLDSDSVEQAEAKGRGRLAAQMVLDGEAKTLQEAADKFEISRQAVHQAKERLSTGSCESQKPVDIPDHLHGDHEKADFRKLSPAGQDRVRAGEPLNRVAVAEGIRRRLSPLEQAQKSFRRLSKEDRDAFDLWRAEQPL